VKKIIYFILQFLLFCPLIIKGQDIALYEQINGRFDFTFIGNTMNSAENNPTFSYVTGTSSSANLNLSSSDQIVRAYLYWAGSGDGDFQVNLNETPITADRIFRY